MATNNETIKDRTSGKFINVAEGTLNATATTYYATDPNLPVNVQVSKGGNSVIVSYTTTANEDIETGLFIDKSTGTTDYDVGDSMGITGFKIAVTYTSGDVKLSIKQYKSGNQGRVYVTETALRKKLKEWLPKNTHYQPVESSTSSGVPDINFCLNGIEVWAELKIVKGKRKLRFQKALSPYQWNWLSARAKAKGVVWVIAQHNEDILLYDCRLLLKAFQNNRDELPANPSVRLPPKNRKLLATILTGHFVPSSQYVGLPTI